MEKELVYSMTNTYGSKFLDSYLKDVEFLGIADKDEVRKEFYLVYRNLKGEVFTCVLPLKENPDDCCCFFGSLIHFAAMYAEKKASVIIHTIGSNFLWPSFYLREAQFNRWYHFYNEIIEKYS